MAQTELDLHPEAKAFLEANKSLEEELASAGSQSMEVMRSMFEEVGKIGGPGVAKNFQGTREELFVDSKDVEGGIPVYVYKPKSLDRESDGVPILIYFHGGGHIMGSRNVVDNLCKVLSSLVGCIVVNVEYRLAPEHKFPAMMNDACAAVRWVLDNRSSVGGTPKSKVGVAGDSAGGHISASVSHHVPGVDFQILIYPWLSPGESYLPSHEAFKNGPLVTEGFLKFLETQVVEKKEDLRHPRFHMLRNEKFDHLPPTLCIVAEFDMLRDESYEYSKRLTAAGVDNQVHLAKGAVHGFFSCPDPFEKEPQYEVPITVGRHLKVITEVTWASIDRWKEAPEHVRPAPYNDPKESILSYTHPLLDPGCVVHILFSKGAFPELGGQAYAKAVEFINKVRKQK